MNKLFALLVKALLGISVVLGGILAAQPASALTNAGTCYQGAIDNYVNTYINTNGKSFFAGENNTGAISYGFSMKSGTNPWKLSSGYVSSGTYTPTGSNGFYTGSKSLTLHMESAYVYCTYTKTFNFYWNMYPQVEPTFTVSVSPKSPSFGQTATITISSSAPSGYGPVTGQLVATINGQIYPMSISGSKSFAMIPAKEWFAVKNSWWMTAVATDPLTSNQHNGFNQMTAFAYVPDKGRFKSVNTTGASATAAKIKGTTSYTKTGPQPNTNSPAEAASNLSKGYINVSGISYSGNQSGGCELTAGKCLSKTADAELIAKGYTRGQFANELWEVNRIDGHALNDLKYGAKVWGAIANTVDAASYKNAFFDMWMMSCQAESTGITARYFDNGQSLFGAVDGLTNYKNMQLYQNYTYNISYNDTPRSDTNPILQNLSGGFTYPDTWESIGGTYLGAASNGNWACNYPATKFNTTTRFTVPAPQKFSTAHSIYIENLNVTKNGDTGRIIKTGSIGITVRNNDTGVSTFLGNASCNLSVSCPRKYTIGALSADANGTSYTVTAQWVPDSMYENNRIFNGSSYSQSFMVYQSFNCNFSQNNGPIKIDYVNPETRVVTTTGSRDASLIRSGELWKITYPVLDIGSNVGGMISAGPTGKYNVASRLYVYGTPTLPAEVRVFRNITNDANTSVELTRQTALPLIFGQGDTNLTGLIGRWYWASPTNTGNIGASTYSKWQFIPRSVPQQNEYVSITWPSTIGPNGSRIPMQLVREVAVYGEAFDPWQSLGERPNVGWHSCSNAQNATSWNPAPPTPGGNPQTSKLTIVSGHLTQ